MTGGAHTSCNSTIFVEDEYHLDLRVAKMRQWIKVEDDQIGSSPPMEISLSARYGAPRQSRNFHVGGKLDGDVSNKFRATTRTFSTCREILSVNIQFDHLPLTKAMSMKNTPAVWKVLVSSTWLEK